MNWYQYNENMLADNRQEQAVSDSGEVCEAVRAMLAMFSGDLVKLLVFRWRLDGATYEEIADGLAAAQTRVRQSYTRQAVYEIVQEIAKDLRGVDSLRPLIFALRPRVGLDSTNKRDKPTDTETAGQLLLFQ